MSSSEPSGRRRRLRRLRRGARNAGVLLTGGRFSEPYLAPFEETLSASMFTLRRYPRESVEAQQELDEPLLLIPPLMVTAEIYDISPQLSAVSYLSRQGVDVWLVDFGAPEDAPLGLERTFDDHIRAVAQCIEHIHSATGKPVHVGGYSQGGIFALLSAAWCRNEGVGSLITFGSPVDIWRNTKRPIHDDIISRVLKATRQAITAPLDRIPSLPGTLIGVAFKVLNAPKEIQQLAQTVRILHDTDALAKREPKRRFLGGEGFVDWPGPALRDFIDELVVANRMRQGGLVIDGRSVSISELSCPVLCFYGTRDDLARPSSVRAIDALAPHANVTQCPIHSGHFGLVVGQEAMTRSWPTVVHWLRVQHGHEAHFVQPYEPQESVVPDASDAPERRWRRIQELSLEITRLGNTLRWQVPRLAALRKLNTNEPLSIARALAQQAERIPEQTFFLWKGRAYSYDASNKRVNQVARVLIARGVGPGSMVGLWLGNTPEHLMVLSALNRIRAVGVELVAEHAVEALALMDQVGATLLITDDDRHARDVHERRPQLDWVLCGMRDALFDDVFTPSRCMSRMLDDESTDALSAMTPNAGTAQELAMLVATGGITGPPKFVRVSNRRWGLAALGAAAACKLTSRDTVYCCVPLNHAMGSMVAASSALVSGARLSLVPQFDAAIFWHDVRRWGVSVVFTMGRMPDQLLNTPWMPGEDAGSLRLFAGCDMNASTWTRFAQRFDQANILSFYASTEGNLCLANLGGAKPGSLGRPLPQLDNVEVVEVDWSCNRVARDAQGWASRVPVGEPGLLVAKREQGHALFHVDGYWEQERDEDVLHRDLFSSGDVWFDTQDVVVEDDDGDYWFVGRMEDVFDVDGEFVVGLSVDEALRASDVVLDAASYPVSFDSNQVIMCAIVLRPPHMFSSSELVEALEHTLDRVAWPTLVRVTPRLPLGRTMRPLTRALRQEGVTGHLDAVYLWDESAKAYMPL